MPSDPRIELPTDATAEPPTEPPTDATAAPDAPVEPAPVVAATPAPRVSPVKEWAVAIAIMIVFALICAQFVTFLRSNQYGGPGP